MTLKNFIRHHFRHFNAAVVQDAAEAYVQYLKGGNKMMVTLAGAMSTAELGLSLGEMIRKNKVHAITCTGANLEEDVFNLVAHTHYKRVPQYRNLSEREEVELLKHGMNRVTDTCIPEDEAMRRMELACWDIWEKADRENRRMFPHEFMYELLRSKKLEKYYEIDPRDSWLAAACKKNLPIFVPGWEDSTLGNMFAASIIRGNVKNPRLIKSGIEYMALLVDWYRKNARSTSIGFFQIGGGIAGDFPICVVPLIKQDLKEKCKRWGYFCQISDSTTSYGSYSGAVPNEKITWGKLDVTTPRFIIESDATIVAPLIFAYILGW